MEVKKQIRFDDQETNKVKKFESYRLSSEVVCVKYSQKFHVFEKRIRLDHQTIQIKS